MCLFSASRWGLRSVRSSHQITHLHRGHETGSLTSVTHTGFPADSGTRQETIQANLPRGHLITSTCTTNNLSPQFPKAESEWRREKERARFINSHGLFRSAVVQTISPLITSHFLRKDHAPLSWNCKISISNSKSLDTVWYLTPTVRARPYQQVPTGCSAQAKILFLW